MRFVHSVARSGAILFAAICISPAVAPPVTHKHVIDIIGREVVFLDMSNIDYAPGLNFLNCKGAHPAFESRSSCSCCLPWFATTPVAGR